MWAVAFACVIAFMGIGLVDPILKPIADQLDATPSQVSLGLLLAITSVWVAPILQRRFGSVPVVLSSLTFFALDLVTMRCSPTPSRRWWSGSSWRVRSSASTTP